MTPEPVTEPIERWTAKRRATLVLSILTDHSAFVPGDVVGAETSW